MSAQNDVRVVLDSDLFGREFFHYPDDKQAFAAVLRLLAEARSAFINDGIECAVGIVVGSGDYDDDDWHGDLS